jgi:hypothetical protein
MECRVSEGLSCKLLLHAALAAQEITKHASLSHIHYIIKHSLLLAAPLGSAPNAIKQRLAAGPLSSPLNYFNELKKCRGML